jgi:hypothetical protein
MAKVLDKIFGKGKKVEAPKAPDAVESEVEEQLTDNRVEEQLTDNRVEEQLTDNRVEEQPEVSKATSRSSFGQILASNRQRRRERAKQRQDGKKQTE